MEGAWLLLGEAASLAGLSARGIQTVGNWGQILLGGVAGNAAYKTLEITFGKDTLAELDTREGKEAWIARTLADLAISGYLEAGLMLRGLEITFARALLIDMQSTAAITIGNKLIESGNKTATAHFFMSALKNGAYKGDPKKLIDLFGEELYQQCGCPKV